MSQSSYQSYVKTGDYQPPCEICGVSLRTGTTHTAKQCRDWFLEQFLREEIIRKRQPEKGST